MQNSFIFDFDSTIVQIESLDEVLGCALKKNPAAKKILAEIKKITDAGMNREIPFEDSLAQRLRLARIHKKNFDEIATKIGEKITDGMPEIFEFLQKKNQQIFIISGGFLPAILPVAEILKIPRENIFANKFFLDAENFVRGIDKKNPLARDGGKIAVVEKLKAEKKLPGKIFVVGDGGTDAEIFLRKKADFFCGFGANVVREKVKNSSPHFFENSKKLLDFFKNFLGN